MAVHLHKPLLCAKDCIGETASVVKYWWEEELKIKWVHLLDTDQVHVALNADVYLHLLS